MLTLATIIGTAVIAGLSILFLARTGRKDPETGLHRSNPIGWGFEE